MNGRSSPTGAVDEPTRVPEDRGAAERAEQDGNGESDQEATIARRASADRDRHPAEPPPDLRALSDIAATWVDVPPARPPEWPASTWEDFRSVALVHGLAPLLARRLLAQPEWQRPEWRRGGVAGWLAHQLEMSRGRAAAWQADVAAVLRALNGGRGASEASPGGRLRAMVLKGPALTHLYAEPAERPMADLDLLVEEPHLALAVERLAGLGYEVIFSGRKHLKLARPGEREIVDPAGEHADNPRPIELHPACGEWLRELRIDLTPLIWEAAWLGELAGAPAWLPAPAAHWIYLLVHACHHMLINRCRYVQLLDLRRLAPAALAGGAGAADTGARTGDVGAGECTGAGEGTGAGGGAGAARGAGEMIAAAMRLADEQGGDGSLLARAVYPPLALLDRYRPGRAAEPPAAAASDLALATLRRTVRERLPEGYAAWADGLDLFSVSYLDAAPWRAE